MRLVLAVLLLLAACTGLVLWIAELGGMTHYGYDDVAIGAVCVVAIILLGLYVFVPTIRAAVGLVILVGIVVSLALWLARIGGTVEVRVGDSFVGLDLPIALLLAAVFVVLVCAVYALVAALRRQPHHLRINQTLRSRAEGDNAVTGVLIALAAGTPDKAVSEVRRARNALGDTPQTLLLAAQAQRLAGREEEATEAYRALAQRPDARFLGLHGLLRQAMARGDWEAALALAKEADAVMPGSALLREERAQLALRMRDWREALALAPPEVPKSVLALAAAEQEPDPAKAAALEKEAWTADRGLLPAALAHAARLRASGSARRARAVLEESWGRTPHPDLAPPYLEGETDPLARLRGMEGLVSRNATHPESRLLVAQGAMEAGLLPRARAQLDAVVKSGRADRRAFLLLSELEEVEHGETAEARAAQARWLREADLAPAAPRWRCGNCGTEHAAWKPICEHCEAVGRIAWTSGAVPVAA